MAGSYQVVPNYYRRAHLDFFARYRSPFYSVTFELDATAIKAFVERRGLPTYLNLAYFFTRALQAIEDFRYRLLDGQVVLYNQLHPALTVPAPGGRFSFCALRFHPEVDEFNRLARPAMERASSAVSLEGAPEPDYVYFTALPKVPFTAFTHVVPDDPAAGQPRVAFGRFRDEGGRLRVPVALLINHLYIDGAALGALAERAQAEFAAPR
jgi:chloramphenicol O-acetyltransferase type A